MDESELPRRLDKLWEIQPTERAKAIKLLSKIFNKILNNPTVPKFGDLNFHKIRTKFEQCKPGFYLLYEAGFKQSMDGKRLQWIHNNDNLILLTKVNNALQQKIKQPIASIPKTKIKKINTTKPIESETAKYRREIQQKMKKQKSEKEKKRQLIKEKIAMQRKEQKIEQKRLLEKVKQQKEKQKEATTAFIKEQMANTMNNMMQEMMKSVLPQNNVDENEENTSENVQQNTENEQMQSENKENMENVQQNASENVQQNTENVNIINEQVQVVENEANNDKMNDVNEIGYDESVVNNLVELEIGTREQCIKASKLAKDYTDPNCVVEALQLMLNNEQEKDKVMDS